MTDDRDLERYLKGDSKLSRRYRDGSRETPPKELDDAILAHARAEARRKGGAMRWLTPVALAASMVLGVNLAWNVYQHAPVPEAARNAAPAAAAPVAANAPAKAPDVAAEATADRKAERDEMRAAKAESELQAEQQKRADATAEAAGREKLAKVKDERARGAASGMMLAEQPAPQGGYAARAEPKSAAARPMVAEDVAAPPASAPAPAATKPVLTEPQKIERLIQYVEKLPGAVFIRNGSEHSNQEAADHMRTKLKYAGDRVKTAEDFIRLCASESSMTHKPYKIRFADGTERNSGDVLREQLKALGP